jgi:hypothetical protein
MEQRAREMGKTSEAAVYRKYINSMKKKTKRMNESVGLITNAVAELEDGLKTLSVITYDSVDQLMQGIAKRNDISPTLLHNQFKAKHLTIPDNWAIRYRMNKMKGIEEAKKMTKKQIKKRDEIADAISTREMNKRYGDKNVKYAIATKLAMKEEKTDKYNIGEEGLRDWFGKSSGTTKSGRKVRGWVQVGGKYDGKPCARQPGQKSTPKCVSSSKRRSMSKNERDSAARRKRAADPNQPQKSGAAKPTNVSTDPKRKMKEEFTTEMLGAKAAMKAVKKFGASTKMDGRLSKAASDFQQRVGASTGEVKVRPRKHIKSIKKANPTYDAKKMKYGDSKIVVKNRKIQVGGGDANKRLGNLTKTLGAATAVGMLGANASGKFNEQVVNKVIEGFKGYADLSHMQTPKQKKEAEERFKKFTAKSYREQKKKDTKESFVNEAKDKKGKGSGTKDACYHKVKSRYSVWPSAYASGALVKCRKVGAANWGNKTKKEGFSPMQVAALEAAGMIELNEAGKKCWKGYKKAGTQKLFGKTYNRCVKAGDELNHDGEQLDERMINVTPSAIRKRAAKSIIKKDLPKVAAGAGALAAGVAVGNKMTSTNEGVEFLKREKKKKKSSSEYLTQRDAGKLAKRKMAKKDQEKVNFLEPEETNESKTRLVKNGHTYKVVLTWRGKTYMVQMFVPSVSRPTRQQIEKEVQKLYPDAKVMSFLPRDLEPGEPTVMMGEEKRDEYGDIVGGPKISKKQKSKNLAKNEKDEDHTTTTSESYKPSIGKILKRQVNPIGQDNTTFSIAKKVIQTGAGNLNKTLIATGFKSAPKPPPKPVQQKTLGVRTAGMREEFVSEDDMKGMSVKSGHKRPTKSGAGMTQKGVEAYRRRNPGSKLKTAVTGKVKKGSKDAKRRKSYCARSAGQMKKFPKAAKDPNSRLRQARRRWKC